MFLLTAIIPVIKELHVGYHKFNPQTPSLFPFQHPSQFFLDPPLFYIKIDSCLVQKDSRMSNILFIW